MRKYAIGIALLLALLLTAGCSEQSAPVSDDANLAAIYELYPELSDRTPEEAIVARVVDGDTFETKTGSKVRLVGVNTPEKYGKVEFYGVEASAYTKQRLEGKAVYMFKDVSETDRYGRLLRFVFIKGDSKMYNEQLLREGYANVMTYPPDVTYAKHFLKVERTARETGAGLWAGEEPTAPATDSNGSAAEEAPSCAEPQIKGNIKSGGKEKIYHVPGGSSYNQTKAEVMFCTEEEAVAAGFRKAAR